MTGALFLVSAVEFFLNVFFKTVSSANEIQFKPEGIVAVTQILGQCLKTSADKTLTNCMAAYNPYGKVCFL